MGLRAQRLDLDDGERPLDFAVLAFLDPLERESHSTGKQFVRASDEGRRDLLRT
jgi:hypothetical protein